ncbi:MAG: M6 family metalloprotease domain-containing protein [Bacteroidales bacterium]|nr:M6 family metalloprotease domain-containing protein [Bacteroidales bacterium]
MKRTLFFIVMFGFSFFAKAAYLENVPMTLTQPDGTKLECFASGDEFYNYLHDAQGFTIIQDHATGFYVYADLQDGELVPTDLVAGRSNPADRLKPYLNISPEKRMERRKAWDVPEHLRKPEVRNRDTNHGTLNNLVIFIRFADDGEFENTFSSVNNMFNENQSGVSMQSYFKEVSYNQINIPTTFYPAPDGEKILSYQDTYYRSFFQPYDATTNPNGYNGDDERTEREHALLERAVNYINANNMIPDDLNVDYNKDGYVDNVCFVVRGNVGAWSSLLWPHQWSLYTREVYINGKMVWTFNFQLADAVNNFNTSTMCHEMNHSLGAPDLYHYSYTGPTPVGTWDLMQSNATPPQHMGAYMKYMYGNWIDEIPEITEPGVYTLHDISSSTNNCYKIASPESKQYYVLEYRKKSVETAIPGTGLLIYRINTYEEGYGNRYWDGVTRFDEVYIFRPGGTTTAEGSINSAYFSAGSGRTAFDATTNPKPFLIDGTVDNGLMISGISAAGETISFIVGSTCDAPTNLTASLSGNEVTLTWDAVEDIESYSVIRNGAVVADNVSITTYVDNLNSYGTYSYCVKSNCPDGGNSMASNSANVNYAYPGPVVTDLTGDVDGNIVTLEWTEPESRTAELHYGTSLATIASYNYWAQVYEPSQLADCFGMAVSRISFMTYITGKPYTLKIYNGDTPDNTNLIATKSFTPTSSLIWLNVTLDNPAYIDCSKKLWITFYCSASNAITMGFYTNADYAKAMMLSNDGVTYYVPNWNGGNTFSACVKTFLTNGTFTYNISKDGTKIVENQSGSSYFYNETQNGFHKYHVTTNYLGGESQPSNSVYVPAGATKQFLGSVNADWSDNANWLGNSKPTASDAVWVKNDISVNENADVDGLYINKGVTATVSSGNVLSVSNDVESLSTAKWLTVESDGAFASDAFGVNGTVKRQFTVDSKDEITGKWHFMSSPVAAAPVSDFVGNADGQNYDLYLYSEPDYTWYNEKTDSHDVNNEFYTTNGMNFKPGRGYLASFGSDATMSFVGVLNTGEVTIPVTASSSSNLKGFNLIGNPYPCSIDWDTENGWGRDVLGENPYIWIYNDDVHQYGAYQLGNEGVGTNGVTNVIASCQGFFVKALDNGNITIDNDVKTTGTGTFRKGNDSKSISIKVTGRNGSDEVMICLTNGKLNNAEKLFSRSETVPSLYLKIDGEKYSIVNVDENEAFTIPMGFECGTTGRFTISSDSDVELVDILTGNVINLHSNSYEFIGSMADNSNRFMIRISNDSEYDEFVYQNGKELIVKGNGRVQVFDCLGRIVIDEFVHNGKIDASALNTGVYVVRTENRNQKIVIKQ